MIIRDDISLLAKKARRSPVIAILGARQVGKTTLARQYGETLKSGYVYLDMESPTDLSKLSDPESYFASNAEKLIIIDEVQQNPSLFNVLRSVIDKDRRPGRFLLLGSASPHLVKGVSESLAGRISFIELTPFQFTEVIPPFSQDLHWFRGGFPSAFLAETDSDAQDWARDFIKTYVERDFRMLFGYELNPSITGRLWQMLAYNHSGLWNAESYARSLGVTSPVVNRYLDFMEGAFLVRKLQPWFNNGGKRLVKSPKTYIRDSGLVHTMNNVAQYDYLSGHPIVGASWEGYVCEQVIKALPETVQAYFYRTHNGAEADLILVKAMKPIAAIEIKLSNAPTISKGFYTSINDLGTENNFVITPNSDTWPVKNITVCSLKQFLTKELQQL